MQASLAVKIAFFSTITWIVLVIGVGIAGAEGAPRSGLDWLGVVVTIILPVVLIWMAAFAADALAVLRSEAASLRLVVDSLRRDAAHASKVRAEIHEDLPQGTILAQGSAPGARSRMGAKPGGQAGARAAGGLGSGGAAAVGQPLPAAQLILGLNFPDSPDDHQAVAALQAALGNAELARVIRASQDVITLLATQGIYMDEQQLRPPEAGLWRRFVEGSRRDAMTGLASVLDTGLGRMLHDLVAGDQILQDAVQHFLRQYDYMLQREVPRLSDEELVALSDTRSGRAFMLLASASRLSGQAAAATEGAGADSGGEGGDGP